MDKLQSFYQGGSEEGLIMELKSSVWTMKGTQVMPKRILIFEDRIEEREQHLISGKTWSMRYEQVAQVHIRRGAIWTDITIESTGGHTIEVKGLQKADAEKARFVLRQILKMEDQLDAPRYPSASV